MNMQCSQYRDVLPDLLSGTLSRERETEVQRHLSGCADCRAALEALRADDALLAEFTDAMRPAVAGIETAVMETLTRDAFEPVLNPSSATAKLFRASRVTYAAAAIIVLALLLLAGRALLPSNAPAVPLAQTLEAMRIQPWIHIVQTSAAGEGRRHEYWENFDARIRARKMPGGKIVYANYAENVSYAYNPNSNKIAISFADDSHGVAPHWNPLEQLSEAIDRAAQAGNPVVRNPVVEDGVRLERIRLDYGVGSDSLSVLYIRDVERNLLIRTETTVVHDGRERTSITMFDYPEQGPEDIYALGVSREAALFDIRPQEGPALAFMDRLQDRFEQGVGDHLAVILESWVNQSGGRAPCAITVLRQKGDRKRCDIYHAFDFKDRPDAPRTLYPRIKDEWPDLTIEQVLEIVDANALERRMLFDGRRTVRWRRDRGQMIRDEHRTDQFKIAPAPLTHSLTNLIWPNLHLRLGSGSSQLKREVRLLPDDPNRSGLVGVQFVEYAAKEDYWFDPGKDDMRIEEVKKQEGLGVVSRLHVARADQTRQGLWYPSVLEMEYRSSNDVDTNRVSRREWRVLLDANPSFDDHVFLGTAPTTSPATVPVEPNAIESSGRVTDEKGRPIADATVLLYHSLSQHGLGNRVVEQTQTNSRGDFKLESPLEFTLTKNHAFAQDSYVLIALHPDYAFGWRNVARDQGHDRFDLVLTTGKSRTITVTDHEGNPLPGARVWLFSAGDRKSANPLFRDYLTLPTDIEVLGAVTDAHGIAAVGNLPETGCSFHATLAGYATGLAFPGQNRIRLSPGATLSGWVLTETDEPVSGAVVRLKTEWMWDFYMARSDEEGYFALVDVPAQGWDMGPWGDSEGANGRYTLTVKHDLYAGQDRKLQLLPGERIDDMVVRVSSQSTRVRCLVLEEGTDEPVAGARISGENAIGRINGYSDADGVFTVVVLPGPTSLRFYSPPAGVYMDRGSNSGDRQIRFEAAGPEMEVVVRSSRVEGRLVNVPGLVLGPEGTPVADVVVYAAAGEFKTATASSYVRPTGADSNGRFELKEVPAGRDLRLYAETKDHRLAVAEVVPIPADVNEPTRLELVLKPTESAVLALEDEEGNVAPDLSIELQPMVGGEKIWPAERRVRTDSLGVLDTDGIVPGLTYYLLDAKFGETGGRRHDGWEKWLKREMVLIPLEQ